MQFVKTPKPFKTAILIVIPPKSTKYAIPLSFHSESIFPSHMLNRWFLFILKSTKLHLRLRPEAFLTVLGEGKKHLDFYHLYLLNKSLSDILSHYWETWVHILRGFAPSGFPPGGNYRQLAGMPVATCGIPHCTERRGKAVTTPV